MKDCVSLDTAKKLKEAGWGQESEKWWCVDSFTFALENHKDCGVTGNTSHIASPTIASLLEALPNEVMLKKMDDGRYYTVHPRSEVIKHAHPADALALLWVALKKKGLV